MGTLVETDIDNFIRERKAKLLEEKNALVVGINFEDNDFSEYFSRPPDKSVCSKIIFHISQPKHMLLVLKRIISMRRFLSTQNLFLN